MLLTHSSGERTFVSAAAGHSCPAADSDDREQRRRTGTSDGCGQECPLSTVPHSHVTLGPLEPWAFSGDWTTTCVLRAGPIRDFNVIVRRGAWSACVSVLRVETAIDVPAILLLYCVEGRVVVDGADLERGGTAILEADAPTQVIVRPSTDGVVLAAQLSRAAPRHVEPATAGTALT